MALRLTYLGAVHAPLVELEVILSHCLLVQSLAITCRLLSSSLVTCSFLIWVNVGSTLILAMSSFISCMRLLWPVPASHGRLYFALANDASGRLVLDTYNPRRLLDASQWMVIEVLEQVLFCLLIVRSSLVLHLVKVI